MILSLWKEPRLKYYLQLFCLYFQNCEKKIIQNRWELIEATLLGSITNSVELQVSSLNEVNVQEKEILHKFSDLYSVSKASLSRKA